MQCTGFYRDAWGHGCNQGPVTKQGHMLYEGVPRDPTPLPFLHQFSGSNNFD